MKFKYIVIVLLLFFGMFFVSAQRVVFTNSVNNVQYSNPSIQSIYGSGGSPFWTGTTGAFDDKMCDAGTDFVLMIPPMGCQPMVVRSDLLAQQNVQVMCQLSSLRVNPLIRVSSIRSIGFTGQMPEEVAGVSFYPARAGIRSYNTLMGDPLYNNVGHVVITLKKNPNEATMPKFVEGNLTARISYDSESAYGVGNAVLYLESEDSTISESSFKDRSSFWNGLGSIRLLAADSQRARFGIYSQDERLIQEVVLKEGETSGRIYLPGFYCQASFRLKLSDFTVPEESALLNIDGESIWVRQGSKILNGRCTVNRLELFSGDTGRVTLGCQGAGTIELSLVGGHSANISLNNDLKNYDITDFVLRGNVSRGSELNWHLGFAGQVGRQTGEGSNLEDLIVLVGSNTEIKPETYTRISQEVKRLQDNELKKGHSENVVSAIKSGLNVPGFIRGTSLIVLTKNDPQKFNRDSAKITLDFNGLIGRTLIDGQEVAGASTNLADIREYLDEADKAVKLLLNEYPQVRGDLNRFGEIALLEQINLVDQLKDSVRTVNLMETFLEKYPDSIYAELIEGMLHREKIYDGTRARSVFEINGKFHTILLRDFRPIDSESKKVSFFVGGQSSQAFANMEENEERNLSATEKIKVSKIHSNRADVELWLKKGDNVNFTRESVLTLRLNEPLERKINNKDYTFHLTNLDVKVVTKVEVLTETRGKQSEANFSYKIGIEQRTIQLNPNKSLEKAKKLNETIQKLEARNEKLGNLIEGWKGVCLATGMVLNLKNLVTGSSGESLARQEVMKAWRTKCQTDRTTTSFGTERSLDACYNENAPQIKKDVDAYTAAVKEINGKIGEETNVSRFVQANFAGKNITIDRKTIPTSEMRNWEEIRAFMLYEKLKGADVSPELKNQTRIEMETRLIGSVSTYHSDSVRRGSEESLRSQLGSDPGILSTEISSSVTLGWTGRTGSDLALVKPNAVLDNSSVQLIEHFGKTYLLVLSDEIGGRRGVREIYERTSPPNKYETLLSSSHEHYNFLSRLYFVSDGSCSNPIRSPVVSYYETGNVKGLAAMVPFDQEKGWYVRVSSSAGSVFSSESKGYTSAAVPETFSICNVGRDGVQSLTDSCTTVSINQKIDRFPINIAGCLLNANQYDLLVRDAQEALRQANRQYSGRGTIRIQVGSRKAIEAARGSPRAQDGPIEQCQDFMSPTDCQVLFNVCDPVMCPVSRCDFGGKYPVSNVIQSGIFGSLMLCLPNFKPLGGDVYVPICLTGVHAGIDGYISVLKAQRDCLVEHGDTGKYVGMCDYLTKVYKCNVFWNQVAPFASNIIPNLFQLMTSGRTQRAGGGEYLTFQTSWNNMESSLDYFQNIYGKNSFTAFKLGDTEQFGVEFCNAFVGTSLPTSSKGLKKMLQPESPYQVYAEFHEVPHTDATVPPTGQYNVLAHIYAGKDQGVSYSVYLKNPPTSSYYAGIPRIFVESMTGFIPAGEQVSLSKSFTAPAGYKELCVNINGKDHCNFGPVTTDFGLNMLSDSYVNKQATQIQIKTEKECIQGTSGVVGFTSINPQAAVTNVVDPRIDLQGIVRICSATNPGEGTAHQNNWEPVGECGDANIRCWLDLRSVQDSTGRILEVAGTMRTAERALDLLNEGTTFNEAQSIGRLVQIKGWIGEVNGGTTGADIASIKGNISELEEKAHSIRYMAEAVYWRFKLYEKRIKSVRNLFENSDNGESIRLRVEPESSSLSHESSSIETKTKYTFEDLKSGGFILSRGGVEFLRRISGGDDVIGRIEGFNEGKQEITIQDGNKKTTYEFSLSNGRLELS
jgi:hypothetical protein